MRDDAWQQGADLFSPDVKETWQRISIRPNQAQEFPQW
jgi:hypothetical protein